MRSFNRTVTERVGALDDRFLGRSRPLAEARLLWEIGTDGADVRELRRRLALDSGYLSRLLRSLERQGLVEVESSHRDRRVRHARLSEAGLSERVELDQRSDALASALLEPLGERQRVKLVAAMVEVERLLLVSMVAIAREDAGSRDARWCFAQYASELDERFYAGFDPTRSVSVAPQELTPPGGLLLVARLREEPVGCGGFKLHGEGSAELKRMWIAPHARGLGLGRRLLAELEGEAVRAGATAIRLETNGALAEAIALYRSAGYSEVDAFSDDPYAEHWFEKRLPARS